MKRWIHDVYVYGVQQELYVKYMLVRYDPAHKTPHIILIPNPTYTYYVIQKFIDGLKSGDLTQ